MKTLMKIQKYQQGKQFVPKVYSPNDALDWSAESWFSQRAPGIDGIKYTAEDAKRLASHVPEYKQIEQDARQNGTWLKMPNGETWTGDPRVWVMMQSKAYKKNYGETPWYTGQAEWPTEYNGINTNKVARARTYNGQMWFSDQPGYAQLFADELASDGIGVRFKRDDEKDIKGQVFIAGIPKNAQNVYTIPSNGGKFGYNWTHMPFKLTNTGVAPIKKSDPNYGDYYAQKRKLLTDDIVNHMEKIGKSGVYMHGVNDGNYYFNKRDENGNIIPYDGTKQSIGKVPSQIHPINEFISLPGLTNKLKFINGNNGDFDPENEDKYAFLNNKRTQYSELNNNRNIEFAKQGGILKRI